MTTKELYDEYMITSMVAGFEPIEVERAHGTTITGSDGKTYLDCFSGISVVNAGHSHPKVIAAAKAQMDKLVHCCTYVYYSPTAGLLAKQFLLGRGDSRQRASRKNLSGPRLTETEGRETDRGETDRGESFGPRSFHLDSPCTLLT